MEVYGRLPCGVESWVSKDDLLYTTYSPDTLMIMYE